MLPDLLASTPAILAQAQSAETQAAGSFRNSSIGAHFDGPGSFTSSFSSASSSFNTESFSRSNSFFPPPDSLQSGYSRSVNAHSDSWRGSSATSTHASMPHPPSLAGGGSSSSSVYWLPGANNSSVATSPHAKYQACWQRFVFVCGAFAVTLAERLQAVASDQNGGGSGGGGTDVGTGSSERGNGIVWPNSPAPNLPSQPPPSSSSSSSSAPTSSSSLPRAPSTPVPTPPPPGSNRRPPLSSNQGSWSGIPPPGSANFTSPPPQPAGSSFRRLSGSSAQSTSYSDLEQFQSLGDSGRRGSWRTESWR